MPLEVPLHVFGQACDWVWFGSKSNAKSIEMGCCTLVCDDATTF